MRFSPLKSVGFCVGVHVERTDPVVKHVDDPEDPRLVFLTVYGGGRLRLTATEVKDLRTLLDQALAALGVV